MIRKGRAKQKKAAPTSATQVSSAGQQQPTVVSQKSLMQAAARKALAEQVLLKQRQSLSSKTPSPSPPSSPMGGDDAGSQTESAVPISPSSKSSLKKSYLEASELLRKEREEYLRQATHGNTDPHHLTRQLLEDKKMGVSIDPLESGLLTMPNFGEHRFIT
jgi:hypothetical protein